MADYYEGRCDRSLGCCPYHAARHRAEGIAPDVHERSLDVLYAQGVEHGRAEGAAALTAAVRELAEEWESAANEDEQWLNGPRVSVSEAQELPAIVRIGRTYASALRALRALLDAAGTPALDRHDAQVRAEALSVAEEKRIRADAWGEGYTSGHSNAMRRMSDEPNAPTTRNPYRADAQTSEGCGCTELCSMGPTCPGGMLAGVPGSGCFRTQDQRGPR